MSQQNDFENSPIDKNDNIEENTNENCIDDNSAILESSDTIEGISTEDSNDAVVPASENVEDAALEESENKTKPKKRKKKKSKIRKILFWILIGFLILILSGVITIFIMIQSGKSSLTNTDGMKIEPGSTISDLEVEDDGRTIEYNGKKYIYNENMTAILCIGVDKENISDETGLNGSNGQADALFLYAMDTSTGKSTVIPIPRDTMVDVDVYSGDGKYVSSSKKQVCLAYAYGDGKKQSCENTVKSVSRLFWGLRINSYVAIDLKAVEVLSKNINGVTVVPNEDFEFGGAKFYKGKKTTLSGREARLYIQGRDKTKFDSNLNRMARQKQFLTAYFSKVVKKTKEDISYPLDVYNATDKYMITDITASEVSFLASCVILNDVGLQYKNIKGEMTMGEKYAEFYANDESVRDIFLDVFYKPAS